MQKTLTAAALAALLILPAAAFANHSFADIDTNGDGKITASEADAVKDKKFADKDTNGDGQITKAEYDAYKAKWADKDDDDHDDDRDND